MNESTQYFGDSVKYTHETVMYNLNHYDIVDDSVGAQVSSILNTSKGYTNKKEINTVTTWHQILIPIPMPIPIATHLIRTT